MEEAGIVAAGADKLAAVDGATMEQVQVTICISKLHCPLCSFPLKPPIFQCDAGHLACSACSGLLFDNRCYDCDCSGSYGRNRVLEDFLRSIRIATTPTAAAQSSPTATPTTTAACAPTRRAPARSGSEAGAASSARRRCSSNTSPPSTPTAPAPRGSPRSATEYRNLFLVSLSLPWSDDTEVSLVCVRAKGGGDAAAAQYTCKLALEPPSGGGEEEEGGVVVMEFKVRSSALPGGTPAKDQRASLKLHQKLEPGDMLALTVRIDRLIQPVGAAAAAGESTATGQIDGVVSSRHTIELATRSNLNSRAE
ncbi:unnamed protein product [Urochloa decumbens]|uniref:E3 ubiquitin-protein ligase Sina-like RING finger domain-containing protein n=1 Tax=Urochloa decumbens TaxID=240449 RepID=A0ABC8ZQ99_9POAL